MSFSEKLEQHYYALAQDIDVNDLLWTNLIKEGVISRRDATFYQVKYIVYNFYRTDNVSYLFNIILFAEIL